MYAITTAFQKNSLHFFKFIWFLSKKERKETRNVKVWVLFWGFVCLFVCLSFGGCTHSSLKFLGQGSNQSCNCQPTPQPQQHGIQATFVTYTTAHGNARSLTHWRGQGSNLHRHGCQSDSFLLSHDGNPKPEALKAWSLDQQHQHNLETCQKCRLLGLNLGLCIRNSTGWGKKPVPAR